MHFILDETYHSVWFRFIFCPLAAWFLSGLFLYGIIGPQWWKQRSQDYWDSNHFIFKPDTPTHIIIAVLEKAIPIGVMLWFAFHH